jgi:hypothetical protein
MTSRLLPLNVPGRVLDSSRSFPQTRTPLRISFHSLYQALSKRNGMKARTRREESCCHAMNLTVVVLFPYIMARRTKWAGTVLKAKSLRPAGLVQSGATGSSNPNRAGT